MNIKLSNGKRLQIFITHVKPELTYEEIIKSKYKYEAALYLGGVNCNGTVAQIFEGDREISTGKAILSDFDSFNKHKGVQVALSRALNKLGFQKSIRTEIWNQVFGNKYPISKRKNNDSNRSSKIDAN